MYPKLYTQKLEVTIISTGGTIEKTYSEIDGQLENKRDLLKTELSRKLRLPYTSLIFETLMAKDSLQMNKADRHRLYELVQSKQLEKKPTIILHGTDTMIDSACYCQDSLKTLTAPVVFTGAMKPFGFQYSDAWQNIIEALYFIRFAGHKVYISFHNNLYNPKKVRKNPDKGTFEAI